MMNQGSSLVVCIVCLLLAPSDSSGLTTGRDCTNPTGPSCGAGLELGTIRGDLGSDLLMETGCGGGWIRFEVVEDNSGIEDLSFVAILTTPDDATAYGLHAWQDCATLVGSVSEPGLRRLRIYFEWPDGWGYDDTRVFGLDVDLVSGTPSADWRLEIQGNVNAVTGSPEGPPRPVVLHQNVPNPFNPTTSIRFTLAEPSTVRLDVYATDGRHVRNLLRGQLPPGAHAATWDGRDAAGRRVASATYVYRLVAGEEVEARRMTLLK
jgi:hypothetical protein